MKYAAPNGLPIACRGLEGDRPEHSACPDCLHVLAVHTLEYNQCGLCHVIQEVNAAVQRRLP